MQVRGRIALEIAAEARAEWGFATDIIARTFRAHRELASGGRRHIAETVYGLIRMDRRLDAIVDELTRRPGGRDGALAPLARDELKLLVYEARAGVPVEALARRRDAPAARADRSRARVRATTRAWAGGPAWIARRRGCPTRPGCSRRWSTTTGRRRRPRWPRR